MQYRIIKRIREDKVGYFPQVKMYVVPNLYIPASTNEIWKDLADNIEMYDPSPGYYDSLRGLIYDRYIPYPRTIEEAEEIIKRHHKENTKHSRY